MLLGSLARPTSCRHPLLGRDTLLRRLAGGLLLLLLLPLMLLMLLLFLLLHIESGNLVLDHCRNGLRLRGVQ